MPFGFPETSRFGEAFEKWPEKTFFPVQLLRTFTFD
jgi:hypothetical protein